MMKRIVKAGVAAALQWSGVNRLVGAAPQVKNLPLVLAYHSVVEDVRPYVGRAQLPNLVSVGMLERQLDWIGRRYRFASLDEIGRQMERGGRMPRPLAAVTFDDGYVGVFDHAVPVLTRKGIPAAAFLVTETVGRPVLQVYDKLYLLLLRAWPLLGSSSKRLALLLETKDILLRIDDRTMRDPFLVMRALYTGLSQHKLRRAVSTLETLVAIEEAEYPELQSLTWDMVRTMRRLGWTIGSHTQTHPLLTQESAQRAANQVVGSMKTLKEQLGEPIEHFAYPDGRFNPQVVSAVARAGYRYGYGTCLQRDPRYPQLTIPRKLMWERTAVDGKGRFSASVMSCHASRAFDLWSDCGHDHGRPASVASGTAEEPSGHRPVDCVVTHVDV